MHLRGPMNVSQLAVYQVPDEASKMQKRSTVSFHNRRASKQRDPSHDILDSVRSPKEWAWTTPTHCTSTSTVISTVTVRSCTSDSSVISSAPPISTYIGPPLSCQPTPNARSTTVHSSHTQVAGLPACNCTCQDLPTVTQNLERHPKNSSKPMPAQSPSPSVDTGHVRRRAADWSRVAYYTSATPAEATGFSFLANLGDPRQSGTFD